MKQRKLDSRIFRNIKFNGIAVLLLGAAILFFGCENDIEKVKAFGSQDTFPILEAYNFETIYTDSGTVRYHLKTPKLLRFENEGKEFVEFPEGMELVQFNADKKIISSMVADYARQYVKEQMWEAKNNVVATNEKGDTLKTEQLTWDEGKKKIYSRQFVEIISPERIMYGDGLEADQDLTTWEITNLNGIIYVDVEDEQ